MLFVQPYMYERCDIILAQLFNASTVLTVKHIIRLDAEPGGRQHQVVGRGRNHNRS